MQRKWSCLGLVLFVMLFSHATMRARSNDGSLSQHISAASVIQDYPPNDTLCVCPAKAIQVRARAVNKTGKMTTYHFQVAFDSLFNDMFSDDMVIGRDTCYSIFAPEPKSATWYWRLTTNNNTDWSATRSIHFIFPCFITALVPTKDTTVCVGSSVDASWTVNGNMQDVVFSLYKDSVNGPILRQEHTGSVHTVALNFTKEGTFVWTVNATGAQSLNYASYLAASHTIHVVQPTVPSFSAPQDASVYVKGKDTSINVSWSKSDAAGSYILWVIGPGLTTFMDTVSVNDLSVPIANLPVGSYSLEIAPYCGPNSTPKFSDPVHFSIINNTQSVFDDAASAALFLFPHPTQNTLFMRSLPGLRFEQLSVVDALGQTILDIHNPEFRDERYAVNTECLSNGCYYLVARADNAVYSRPFVVSR